MHVSQRGGSLKGWNSMLMLCELWHTKIDTGRALDFGGGGELTSTRRTGHAGWDFGEGGELTSTHKTGHANWGNHRYQLPLWAEC
jgi:hypothetical protein